MTDTSARPPETAPRCFRHGERETYIRCSRCDRPICPDCMHDAAVGFHCPECVREAVKSTPATRTVFGGVYRERAVVTLVLIVLNVMMFFLQQLRPVLTGDFGLLNPALPQGEYYRLFTAAFLHGGLIHLALNMVGLWMFGPLVEMALGRSRFVALYLLSALGGSTASFLFSPWCSFSVGASGALFGLLGAMLVINRKLSQELGGLVVLLAVNVAYGFMVSGIDWRAHLGGLVVGGLVALVFTGRPAPRRQQGKNNSAHTAWILGQLAGCLIIAGILVVSVGWKVGTYTGGFTC